MIKCIPYHYCTRSCGPPHRICKACYSIDQESALDFEPSPTDRQASLEVFRRIRRRHPRTRRRRSRAKESGRCSHRFGSPRIRCGWCWTGISLSSADWGQGFETPGQNRGFRRRP